jgi:hypothetical protein
MTAFGARRQPTRRHHKVNSLGWRIFTIVHVIRRIASDRASVAEPGAFGIRQEPAAAIARLYGGQTRRAPGRGRMWRSAKGV